MAFSTRGQARKRPRHASASERSGRSSSTGGSFDHKRGPPGISVMRLELAQRAHERQLRLNRTNQLMAIRPEVASRVLSQRDVLRVVDGRQPISGGNLQCVAIEARILRSNDRELQKIGQGIVSPLKCRPLRYHSPVKRIGNLAPNKRGCDYVLIVFELLLEE